MTISHHSPATQCWLTIMISTSTNQLITQLSWFSITRKDCPQHQTMFSSSFPSHQVMKQHHDNDHKHQSWASSIKLAIATGAPWAGDPRRAYGTLQFLWPILLAIEAAGVCMGWWANREPWSSNKLLVHRWYWLILVNTSWRCSWNCSILVDWYWYWFI